MNHVEITEKEFADLRYSIIDAEGVEVPLPIRWHTFRVIGARLVVHAATDPLPSSIYGMSVVLDHLKRVTTVEIVDADSVGHYADWHMKADLRGDLLQAVKVFAWRTHDTGAVREWWGETL